MRHQHEETPPLKVLVSDAMISQCGTYRYWLRRVWDEAKPQCAWIMLNPSTADATKDDRTIRRVIGFSASWGFGGAHVYNLFALRSTDPRQLRLHSNPIGPENDDWLSQIPESATVVAAWGDWGDHLNRALRVREMFNGRLSCLEKNKSENPRHPLYIPAARQLTPYGMALA